MATHSKLVIPPPSKRSQPVNPDPERFELNGNMLVCRETLLPSYKDAKDHAEKSAKHFPGFVTEKSWRCVHCGWWHFTGYFPRNTNKGKGANGKV